MTNFNVHLSWNQEFWALISFSKRSFLHLSSIRIHTHSSCSGWIISSPCCGPPLFSDSFNLFLVINCTHELLKWQRHLSLVYLTTSILIMQTDQKVEHQCWFLSRAEAMTNFKRSKDYNYNSVKLMTGKILFKWGLWAHQVHERQTTAGSISSRGGKKTEVNQ